MSLISGEFVFVVSPLAVCERMNQNSDDTTVYGRLFERVGTRTKDGSKHYAGGRIVC